jgi:hypothetical protein
VRLAAVAIGALIGAVLGLAVIFAIAMRMESNSNNSIGMSAICVAAAGGTLIGGIIASNAVRK